MAVVFNGSNSLGIDRVRAASPEHLLIRPNLGFDPAALDFGLKNTPTYENYFLLHDDHWFVDDHWVERCLDTLARGKLDAAGNLVPSDLNRPPHFKSISRFLGYESYQISRFPFFLQGMAGVYRRSAIDCLMELDGVPHVHANNKEVGWVCERIHSFILLDRGMRLGQLPPGYEKYLRHRDF